MRKFILTLMASLLSCSAASAFWPEATDSSLEIGVGYRQDSVKWNIHSNFDSRSSYGYSGSDYGDYGTDCIPLSLKSKLHWKNLNIWQIEGRGRYITCDNVYLRGNADYGWITSGKNTDKDYIAFGSGSRSGSGFEFANSHSKVKGHVYDVKLALGYQFKMCDDSFSIAPLIGYSWHGQHLQDSHLKQSNRLFSGDNEYVRAATLNGAKSRSYSYSDYYSSYYDSYGSNSSSYGSCSYGGNHSKYHTRWNGPFIGFDLDYILCCEWALFGGYEFHWAEYHARGDWSLRSDLFDGFSHHAKNAYGNVLDLGVKWDFCECWTLALRGEFSWWYADKGHDSFKISEGRFGDVKTECLVSVPLRKVEWNSASITLDLGMVF